MNTEAIVEKAKKELAKEKGGAVWLAMIELSEYIVFSAIAKNYFKKSSNWILQRLHGYEVNGKPAQFKPREITIFTTFQNVLIFEFYRFGVFRLF